ncbi:phage tail tape measure protein [Caldilinea sp.]|uniref:phage tail tape measure protein n=1 Tax=Caldilinea sp. TaxID=2293560 RepID=UPI0021DCC5D7|nr:phage tail tape measure protein [Caldilinea sp.]GIV73534.1 MAG: hypothetical protein KatS3mg049_2090 [Caldilinea sp.]
MSVNLGSAYGEIQISTGQAERNVASLSQTLRRVGGQLSLAISTPLAAVAGAGLRAAAAFEQSMNQVRVVSGATEQAMAQLQAKALQLGRDTSFSAGEAAAGMLELAKAGLGAQETMDAIAGVLDLAAAGNLSVAQAAEISANALNAFNLPAAEATRVANLLAAAANSSSVEVGDLAAAFQMSSAVFAGNRQSIDDLATAIAILGNNGLKGSDAGTSLKTMLMRLTAPTDSAREAMEKLGIQVYNADGSMRSFQDIVAQLQQATAGLTDAQRNQALTTIFGADAIRAANILIAEGADEFARMKEAVNQAGAAQQVADARMRGLAGAIAYARGTIESTLIAAFAPMTEGLARLIRAGADLIARFGELPAPVRNAALAFAAVMAAVGPLLLAIPAIGAALGALLSPIGLVVVAVAGLAAAWAADFGGIREKTAAVWAAIQPQLQALQGWLAARLPGALASLRSTWTTAWEALPGIVEQAQGRIQSAWATVMAFLAPALSRLRDSFDTFRGSVGQLAPKFQEFLGTLQNLWQAIQPILTMLGGIIVGVLGVAAVGAVNMLAASFNHLVEAVGIVLDQLVLLLNSLADIIRETVNLVSAILRGDWTAAWQSASNIVGIAVAFMVGSVSNLLRMVQAVFGLIFEAIMGTLEDLGVDTETALDALQNTWTTAWEAVERTVKNAIDGIVGTFETLQRWLTNTLRSAINDFKSFLAGISLPNPFQVLTDTLDSIQRAIDSVRERINGFKEWLGGLTIPNPFSGISLPGLPGIDTGATGIAFASGGLTLVGERGPELVELPRGARVYDAGETARMLAEPMRVENHYHIYNDLDVESVAYRVAQVLRRRGR